MMIKVLICLILCAEIGLIAADDKFDLKSFLLSMLNKVKTKSQSETATGVKLSSSHDTKSADDSGREPSDISSDFQRDKIFIIKGALDEIHAEIASLEAKYKSELESAEEHANRPWRVENNGDSQFEDDDDNFELLVEKMKTAAHSLIRLRMTLAEEFGIGDFKTLLSDNVRTENVSNDNEPNESPVQVQSTVYKLMKIVEGLRVSEKGNTAEDADERMKLILDSFGQPRVDTKAGLTKPVQINKAVGESRPPKMKERDWHSQNCKSFLDDCLGWDAVCCDEDELKPGYKFSMCCSLYYNKSFGKKQGICLPNPLGKEPCPTFS